MLVSLCIPTNGIIEWVKPVIESIYNQNVSIEAFELIVVDNGDNNEFKEYIDSILLRYSNLKYKRVKCSMFMNEIIAYKMASGDFIKFINHRTVLMQGALQKWIDFMVSNYKDKPLVYFSNGVLNKNYEIYTYDSFDEFMYNLGYWSSWSTGMSMWKEDIDGLCDDDVNELFPHTAILFKNKINRKYIIDNNIYLSELKHSSKKKGTYDLFYAFAVEFPSLLLDLYKKDDISLETFLRIKNENASFIVDLYNVFVKNKTECSYDLNSFDNVIKVFYSEDIFEKVKKSKRMLFEREWKLRKNNKNKLKYNTVVFGAGIKGREYIQKINCEKILCFIDNNERIQDDLILGIPVLSLETYMKQYDNEKIVVCAGKDSCSQIEKQLNTYNLTYIVID